MTALEHRVLLVTGAGSGIGRAVALRAAAAGALVAAVDLDLDRAIATVAEVTRNGGHGVALGADVADVQAVESAFDEAERTLGLVRMTVTAAGIASTGVSQQILEIDDEHWRRVLAVNLDGTFYCARTAARRLVAAGLPGSIVMVSSLGATRPTNGFPAYHASKGGVEGLTRSLAVSLAEFGIRVNAVAPGYTLTEMTRDGLDDRAIWEAVHSRIPLGRMAAPEEIAAEVVHLASDAASYLTGQVVHVDGGAGALGWTPATIRAHFEAAP